MSNSSIEGYIKSRNRDKILFYLTVAVGTALFVDIPFPPIPPNVKIVFTILFFILSLYFYKSGFSIENDMKQLSKIAESHEGYLTIPIVSMELDISIKRAEIIVLVMEKRGYLTLVNCGDTIGENTYKFLGLTLVKPESDDIITNVEKGV